MRARQNKKKKKKAKMANVEKNFRMTLKTGTNRQIRVYKTLVKATQGFERINVQALPIFLQLIINNVFYLLFQLPLKHNDTILFCCHSLDSFQASSSSVFLQRMIDVCAFFKMS